MRRATFPTVLLALALLCAPAQAREIYLADPATGSVAVIETASNAVVAQIPVGGDPGEVAIGPDGRRAYLTSEAEGAVSVIDTASKSVLGPAIAVGAEPRGIAITPDGSRAYVANAGSDSVSVIDLGAGAVIATIPLEAEAEPEGVAIAPDGATAYVAQRGGGVALISTQANALTGEVVTQAGLGPSQISILPEGGRAFLSNANSSSVSVLSTITATTLGSPLLVGANPAGVAVNPNGPRTYVATEGANAVVALQSASAEVVGPPVGGFGAPARIAIAPDGNLAYVSDEAGGSVTILDTLANTAVGRITVGGEPRGIAIAPNQAPRASFSIVGPARAERATLFDASASLDPDGQIATYSWDFGDGQQETSSIPTVEHLYEKPGPYTATLTLTDSEGCSSELRFTGQTAACNGSPAASAAKVIEARDVTAPAFGLLASRRQPLRGFVVAIARCPQERCSVRAGARLTTTRPAAGKAIREKAKTKGARASLANGIEERLILRVPRSALAKARRALRGKGTARVRITAAASDPSANAAKRRVSVSLFAPKRRGAGR